MDLTAQPVAPFLAAATAGLWVPASQAHVPAGLFEPTSYVSPRLGVAWRPLKSGDLVIRAGYGIFTSSYRGNITASPIICASLLDLRIPILEPRATPAMGNRVAGESDFVCRIRRSAPQPTTSSR